MNIEDVVMPQELVGDPLDLIFLRQKELMDNYEGIERSNGLLETDEVPVNIHSGKGQARLKNFAWRITEELAEAMDANTRHSEWGWFSPHAREEVADAFHFLVEMTILSGVTPEDLIDGLVVGAGETPQEPLFPLAPARHRLGQIFRVREDRHHASIYDKASPAAPPFKILLEFIRDLGMVCHTLKQKPWKQSHMTTDVAEYRKRLVEVFGRFIDFCLSIDMDADELFDLYFRKSEVNKFRQRSQY